MSMTQSRIPFLTAILTLTAAASAQSPNTALASEPAAPVPARRIVEPFPRLADTGAEGFVTAWFDEHTWAAFDAAHGAGGITEVRDLPLPGGASATLLLRPVEVWEAGGTAIAIGEDGETTRVVPSVRMFSAFVPGRPSRGFLAISPTMLNGYLNLEGVNYFLSSGADPGHGFTISHQEVFGEPDVHGHSEEHGGAQGWCHYQPLPSNGLHPIGPGTRGGSAYGNGTGAVGGFGGSASAANTVQEWETSIFIEVDRRARGKFQSAQEAVDYVTLLVGAATTIYERDIGMRLLLPSGYVRVSNGISDPWEGYPGGYQKWFESPANPLYPVQRGLVNRLTRFGRGSAENGLLCDQNDPAFASSEIKGFFPSPTQHTSKNNWDLYAFGMENGHAFSSPHTQNYLPPIPCDDGSGPDQGTLMSYCAFPTPIWQPKQAVVEKIGMRYHERVQTRMRDFFRRKRCIPLRAVRLGDFDDNGILDMADLAEFDAFLLQGFRSQAAEEILDINRDGVVDGVDRGLLSAMLIPGSTSTVHNGSGTNCLCLGVVNQPVMGSTFQAVVGVPSGGDELTAIFGARHALASPIPTRFGEALIRIAGFGGGTLFTRFARARGGIATHTMKIPYSPSFAGVSVEMQAF
ncbi:MAG TPA: hypothetical protein ENJ09_08290, partial [Planctomycetes bacterium]|nr:hypothetical protein [Planctomycetota bacterium]